MNPRPVRPPVVAVWLLERLLPRSARDAVIGDLLEEFDDLGVGGVPARRWFWAQALRLGGRYSWFRLSTRFARLTGRPGWGEPSDSAARMRGAAAEFKLALRRLAHQPAFTTTAVVTLGLGIGATTAVFSVVDQVLLEPFPYRNPARLVILWNRMTERSIERAALAGPDVRYLQDNVTNLSGVVSIFATSTNLTGEGKPVEVVLSWVTPNFFEVLGVDPVIGRNFRASDQVLIDPGVFEGQATSERPLPTILSHSMWLRRYRADPAVIGRLLHANGQTFRVIGVAQRGFRLHMPPDRDVLAEADLWTLWPFALADMAPGPDGSMVALGRLATGTSLEEAQGELDNLTAARRGSSPGHAAAGFTIEAVPLVTETVKHVTGPLMGLFAAVVLVLLVAAINVAGLVLARGTSRGTELALRTAMGGSRWHLLRQGMLEALFISVAGAAVGLVLASLGLEVIRTTGPLTVPRLDQLSLDVRALGFGAGLTGVMTLVVGLIPALQVSHTSPAATLGGRAPYRRRRLASSRRVLVVLQVAASVMLLVGAGAVLKQFARLIDADPGFSSEDVLTLRVALPFFAYPTMTSRADFFDRLSDSLQAVPGVEQVGGVTPVPFSGDSENARSTYTAEDALEEWGDRIAIYRPIMPGFHASVGVALITGRLLTNADNAPGTDPVVVVDRRLGESLWPDGMAVGNSLWVLGPHFGLQSGERVLAEVVGVVDDVRYTDPTRDDPSTVYVPHRFWSGELMDYTIRTSGDPLSVAAGVRSVVARLDPELPIRDLRPLGDFVSAAKAPARFVLTVLAAFAAVALLLSAVGLYGLLVFSVRRRTHELGIRVALGAEPTRLVGMVLGEGLGLAVVGLTIGAALAFGLTTAAAPLFAAQPADPPVYGVVAVLIVLVAGLASAIPARWATSVDPVTALKAE
jgi:putative ABC transport system permease protein